MITASKNSQVKNLTQLIKKAKARNEQRLFVVEGIKMFAEAPGEWMEKVYLSESFEREEAHRKLTEGISYEVLSDSVYQSVSDTRTPQGILALLRQPEYRLEDLLVPDCRLLILEDIQDPGNLGTMLRSAEAAGVDGVVLSKKTADIFNPKVIRSTMGSIFRVKFVSVDDFTGTLDLLKQYGVRLFAADLAGTGLYHEADYRGKTGFLIGNEGNGLSPETLKRADTRIRIPMEGQVESLNAAIAATLLMYEAARQRTV